MAYLGGYVGDGPGMWTHVWSAASLENDHVCQSYTLLSRAKKASQVVLYLWLSWLHKILLTSLNSSSSCLSGHKGMTLTTEHLNLYQGLGSVLTTLQQLLSSSRHPVEEIPLSPSFQWRIQSTGRLCNLAKRLSSRQWVVEAGLYSYFKDIWGYFQRAEFD